LSAVTLVHLNGVFEIIFGTALLLGFFTQLSAFLLALHMLDITFTVGFDSIGVRDFGLSIATIVIFSTATTGSVLMDLFTGILKIPQILVKADTMETSPYKS